MTLSLAKATADLAWLKRNPHFEEKPATITEFLGTDYLNIESKVRKKIKEILVEIFGTEVDGHRIASVPRGMITGGIGIGKTTFASIVLPYMAHWVLCLKDPQDFFNLLPGSRIAFMMMSTSEGQAREVLFGDVNARIERSPWFRHKYPKDPAYKNQIRFPAKDVWIVPGDSADTTFEGYNILGGIVDEADSHKVTKEKDYAEDGYNTISTRIESRFGLLGYLLVIGQMKKSFGFAARKYREFLDDPDAHAHRMAIWESFGWDKYTKPDGTRDSFFYDTKRKIIVPSAVIALAGGENILEVPTEYRRSFENNPVKALKDLAGIPPEVGDPFIALVDRIEDARDRWIDNHRMASGMQSGSPVTGTSSRPQFADWFRCYDSLRRVVHVDFAYSSEGDALGLSMGHISHLVEDDDEEKPYIIIDCMLRMKAAAGTEIILGDVRRLIYELRDERGFNIRKVTLDGFQGKDTEQQLKKKRFKVEYLSIDRNMLPYEDLRDAIYEQRIEFPPYLTELNRGDEEKVEIAIRELTQLENVRGKIDHPKSGSKDVADTLAGVVTTLMGDRTYRRGVTSQSAHAPSSVPNLGGHPPRTGSIAGLELKAPIPPPILSGLSDLLPPHLR